MTVLDDAVRHDAPATSNAGSDAEPGWGTSYGFDRGVVLPGDAAIAEQAGQEPGWGAADGTREGAEVGPFFDALDQATAAIGEMQALLADRSVPAADLAAATVRLHALTCRVQAAHLTALGQTVAANAHPPGSPTPNAWIGTSHHLDSTRAGKARKDAAWLAEHPAVAEALASGAIGVDHVTVMRTTVEANPPRHAAFPEFEAAAIAAAALTDPVALRQIMKIWATTVDPDSADDDADEAYQRRRVFLSRVADGWALNGHLPDLMGAELAGVLNAFMEQLRPTSDETDSSEQRTPASARRADALLVIAQAAATGVDGSATPTTHEHADADTDRGADDGAASNPNDSSDIGSTRCAMALPPTSLTRAHVTITVPITKLHTCDQCCMPDHTAGLAVGATWAVGNGPGTGDLAPALARWATCDANITRLILDPTSRPLDLGRTQRVVPLHLRRTLEVRDSGCIIPGCDRPPGWCHAHHIQHWADGGGTDLENLALLCRRHHTELHLGHWRITMHNGKPRATHIPAETRAEHRRHQRTSTVQTAPRRE